MTLNIGLRHEWESGPYDDNDIFSRYLDLSKLRTWRCRRIRRAIPADLLALSTPKYNGAWVFTDSENRKPFDTQKTIFLPRIGLAVRVNDKTAVNIGFARYVVPVVVGQGTTSANTLAACHGARGSIRHPLHCPSPKAVRRHISPIRFPADSNPLQLPIGKSLGAYTNVGNPANWAGSGLSGADQRSRQLHDHARDSRPVQGGCDLVHEHRTERAARSAA